MKKFYIPLLFLFCCVFLQLNAQRVPKSTLLKYQAAPVLNAKAGSAQSPLEDFGPAPSYSMVHVFENLANTTASKSSSDLQGLEIDRNGNFYHYGYVSGNVNGLGNSFEGKGAILTKTDPQGNMVWNIFLDGAMVPKDGFGRTLKISEYDSTVYINGSALSPISIQGLAFTPTIEFPNFTAKITADGLIQWIKPMPGDTHAVDVDAAGNVYVSGIYETTFTFGAETSPSPMAQDAYLLSLDKNGGERWVNFYGGEEIEYVSMVSVGPDNMLYFSGEFTSRNLKLPNKEITYTESEGDIFLSKLQPDGAPLWEKMLGSGNYRRYAWPINLEISPAGNAYMTGWVGLSANFDEVALVSKYQYNNFIASFDSDGNVRWAKIIQTENYPFNYSEMDLDEAGNAYFGGSYNGEIIFNENNTATGVGTYIAKYSATGDFSYAKTYQTSYKYQLIGGMALSKEDDIFVNGQFTGDITFEGNTYSSDTVTAYFINISEVPPTPMPPETPTEPLVSGTSAFTLTGKGAADDVLLRVAPQDAIIAYEVIGDQLIITWNPEINGRYSAGNERTAAETIEVSISIAYQNNQGVSEYSEPFVVFLKVENANGIEEDLLGGKLNLFPNPVRKNLHVLLPKVLQKNLLITLTDVRGVKMQQATIPSGGDEYHFITEALAPGMYLLQLRSPDGLTVTKRFLKY